jgi:hypothetical protein
VPLRLTDAGGLGEASRAPRPARIQPLRRTPPPRTRMEGDPDPPELRHALEQEGLPPPQPSRAEVR